MSYRMETFVLTPLEENCYVLHDEQGLAIVIDPGENSANLTGFLRSGALKPQLILLTHGHFDHMGGAAALASTFRIPVAVHELEAPLLEEPFVGGARLFGFDADPVRPDLLLSDGQAIRVGRINLEVLHTPGHSPGSVTFLDRSRGRAFCGDLIFRGAIGRYDLPGASGEQLYRSIQERILTLPDEVELLPGHGQPTTVGLERRTNPFLIGRS